MKPRTIAASRFKAECLRLMDEVAASGQPIVITKHRRPVAQLEPMPQKPEEFLGRLQGRLRVIGDIVSPITPVEDWEILP